MDPSNILIVGCGYIGGALGERLTELGHEVWGLRRNTRALPPDIHPIPGDLTLPETYDLLPPHVQYVVFDAAANSRKEESYRRIFVDGLHYLLRALEDRPSLHRIVMLSSTGIYGDHHGGWVDEDTPPQPLHIPGQTILQGEQVLRSGCAESVVVRLSGIYGPARTRLIRAVRKHTATYNEELPQYLNQIHRDDCVAVLEHLLFMEKPEPLYIASDREPALRREVLSWLAERMQTPLPRAINEEQNPGKRYRGNKRCSSKRLLESGYHFKYPTYREGYTALLR